jgi:chemotaxis protein CheD
MDLPYSTEDLPTDFDDGYTSDKHVRQIDIGEYGVTDTGDTFVTYGLGSCLGVALFDERKCVTGVIHIKRPTAPRGTEANNAAFADTGIRMLFDEMQSYGATSRHTNATLVGGIDTGGAASAVNMGIGQKNINQARETLDTLAIPVSDTVVGGTEVLSIYFDGASGEATIETNSTD